MRISSRSKAVSWSNRSFSAINRTRPNRLSIVQPWVASDRHTFFDARCACQKLIRLIGIGVPPWLRPELPVSAPDQWKVLGDDQFHRHLPRQNYPPRPIVLESFGLWRVQLDGSDQFLSFLERVAQLIDQLAIDTRCPLTIKTAVAWHGE